MARKGSAMPAPSLARADTGSGPHPSMSACSDGPWTYWVASHGTREASSASTTAVVNTPLTRCAAATSRANLRRSAGLSASSGRTVLTATNIPDGDLARYTRPIPPAPILRSTVNGPRTRGSAASSDPSSPEPIIWLVYGRMGIFGGRERRVRLDQNDLTSSVMPFVNPPGRLPDLIADGAPVVLPGLVMATALRMGDQVNFLPVSAMTGPGGPAAMWEAARANAENLTGIQVVRERMLPERPDTAMVTLSSSDPFVAARVTVLDWLEKELFGAPPAKALVVALPIIRRLIVHQVTGPGTLPLLESLAPVAATLHNTAAPQDQISPNVFLVTPDRRAQRVAFISDDQVVINTTGLLNEILASP